MKLSGPILSASLPAACALLAGCEAAFPVYTDGDMPLEVAAPEAARLQADVAWLADDAREGRRAGTLGERVAADWIATRFAALGLEPIGERGWFQEFSVELPARDLGTSSLALGLEGPQGAVHATFSDSARIVPLFCSSAERAVGCIAFAGYGIRDPELGWDDYAGLDVEGKVVVVIRGTPPDELLTERPPEEPVPASPHGAPVEAGSGWGGSASIFQKVMEAKRHGAAAVLVALHPDRRHEGLLPFDAGRTAQANIPALMVDFLVAQELVPDYAHVVRRIDGGERRPPVALDDLRVARVRPEVARESGVARNVLGRIRGTRRGNTVLLGAHFDHLGRGGPGSLARDSVGEIHNGADDNASGTAVALEIARLFSADPPEGDLIIALWSGEELGLLGSEWWARNPTVPLSTISAHLNLDMVGRAGDGVLQVLGAGTSRNFVTWLDEVGPRVGLTLKVNASGRGVGGSDHQTFLKRSIPALHFFSGVHTDYHRPSDDVERFEADGAVRVTSLVQSLTRRIMAASDLTWVEPPETDAGDQGGGFRTRFGSVPEYSYEGEGLLLAGTSPGGPAERAGLLEGDLIVRIDDVVIEAIGDFMYVLNSHKPGDVVRVHFRRGEESLTAQVTLDSNEVE